jgi:succinate-semialdehyde dehydrogenase / glutarate-semialdehyde dehydrogenase
VTAWWQLMAEEMGKPLEQGRGEARSAPGSALLRRARGRLPGRRAGGGGRRPAVRGLPPLGVVLSIMPWNFPFWQVFRFAAPAHDGRQRRPPQARVERPGSAGAIEGIFRQAGAPDGLFRTLYLDNDQAGDLIEDGRPSPP